MGLLNRVNAVAPGVVTTEMIKKIPTWRLREYRQAELIREPISAKAVAESILFLLAPSGRHYSGAVLDINNGCFLG